MNERIQELAEQAGMRHPVMGEVSYAYFNHEKFAELIIKECIQICNSRVGNSDYNTGRMHCVSDIKEHFGVE